MQIAGFLEEIYMEEFIQMRFNMACRKCITQASFNRLMMYGKKKNLNPYVLLKKRRLSIH